MQSIRRHAQASFRLHHVVALVHSDERGSAAALGAALGQRASRGAVNMLANALRPLLRSRDTALALDAH